MKQNPFLEILLDNPNYFDIDSIPSPAESRSNSGIFTFRKRTSSSNKSPQPSTIGIYNNIDGANLGKRRSSLKNLWRSRSNSASIHYTKVIKIFEILIQIKLFFFYYFIQQNRIIKIKIRHIGMYSQRTQ